MPVENEHRYVVHDNEGKLRRRLLSLSGITVQRIHQAYLAKGTRIRRTEDERTSRVEWSFAYKNDVTGHVVEIETPISFEDFERLWDCALDQQVKSRIKFIDGEIAWDVDFFGKRSSPYFVKAEAELPDRLWDCHTPPAPAPVLAPYVLYTAGKENGFTSRKLGDRAYAERLMEKLLDRHRKVAKRIERFDPETEISDVPGLREDSSCGPRPRRTGGGAAGMLAAHAASHV
ncbi:hypothetical protein ACVIGB_000463 [Bradyrhizobium sp. USDA 4341]